MLKDEMDPWELETSPPTAAEAGETAKAMRAEIAEHGIAMRVWEHGGGVAGADGWVHATSRAGGYSVDLPGRYDDISQYFAADPTRVALHLLRATVDGVSYDVHREHLQDGSRIPGIDGHPIQDAIGRMRRGWARNPHTTSLRDVELAKWPGFEVRTFDPAVGSSVLRAFDAAEKGTYVLTVEGPRDRMEEHDADVDQFLESFDPSKS